MQRGSAKIIFPVDRSLPPQLLEMKFDELQVAFAGGIIKVASLTFEFFIVFFLLSASTTEDASAGDSDWRLGPLGPDRHAVGYLIEYLLPAGTNELADGIETAVETSLPAVFPDIGVQHGLDSVRLSEELFLIPVLLENPQEGLLVPRSRGGQLVELVGDHASGLD